MKREWKQRISGILAALLLMSLTACASTGGENAQNGNRSGNDAGQLNPGGAATRAEVAQMLYNYSNI